MTKPDSNEAQEAQALFSKLDVDFIRVLEDLIDALIANGTLRMTDLPVEAQRKLADRKQNRSRLFDLNLLDDDATI